MDDIYQIKPSDFAEGVAAIARWEGEGGAQMHRCEPSRQVSALTGSERCILECLGAAVVKEWNELPTAVQRALFSKAAVNMDDPAQLKALIARFLHNNKNGSASMTVKT